MSDKIRARVESKTDQERTITYSCLKRKLQEPAQRSNRDSAWRLIGQA